MRIPIPVRPVLAAALLAGCGGGDPGDALHVYVGGTMRPALEEIVHLWEAGGGKVDLDYGDSGACTIKAEQTRRGDLIVVHDPFHDVLEKKGLLGEGRAAATLEPAIAVAKGNPKGIAGLKDLVRPGIRVVLTDPKYSTAGSILERMAAKAGISADLERTVLARTRSGGEAANAVVLGNADATVAWSAVIRLREKDLDLVPIEAEFRPDPRTDPIIAEGVGPIDPACVRVTVDVLRSSSRPGAALAFAEFAASDKAAGIWRRQGFGPPPPEKRLGPPPKEISAPGTPASILVLAGAGLRPPVEEMAAAFTARTGIVVERDFGGSGVILSRLKLSRKGDVFIPGDEWYLDLAEKEGLLASRAPMCWFVPVILVQEGNPKGIGTLEDLLRPGLRIGLGNPETCQVGRSSEAIIARGSLDRKALERNLAFSSVTVNELGIQVGTGHLDAAIVWDAVAAQYADRTDAVAIPRERNVPARVAVAVLKTSGAPGAAADFALFAGGDEGRAVLGRHGYRTSEP